VSAWDTRARHNQPEVIGMATKKKEKAKKKATAKKKTTATGTEKKESAGQCQ